MLDKNQIIHDVVMLYLEKTYDFQNELEDIAQFAIEYESQFDIVKNQLSDFTLEDE